MLIGDAMRWRACDGVAHAAEEAGPLAAYFDAARGAFSPNTERALRADVEIFTAWCRHHLRVAVPASAATVVAFIDDRARVKAPATVRRYVSSIATLHRALRHTNPLEHARVRFALQRMHRRRGRRQAQVQGLTWPLRNRLLEAAGDRLIDAPEPRAPRAGLRHAAAALRAGGARSA